MTLSSDERQALINLRFEKAEKAFEEMERNFELGMYSTAANRLYYSLFYASSALLLKDGYEAHTHGGVLSLINLHYIKEGKIDKSYSKLLRDIFYLRQGSDYDDYFNVGKDDFDGLMLPAKEYIERVKMLVFDTQC